MTRWMPPQVEGSADYLDRKAAVAAVGSVLALVSRLLHLSEVATCGTSLKNLATRCCLVFSASSEKAHRPFLMLSWRQPGRGFQYWNDMCGRICNSKESNGPLVDKPHLQTGPVL